MMVQVAPWPLFSRCGMAWRTDSTVETMSMSIALRQPSGESSVPSALTLETKWSSPPSAAKPSIHFLSAGSSVTSRAAPCTRACLPRHSSSRCFTSLASRAQKPTTAPSATKASTMARPMLLVPPVTSTRLPFKPKSMFPPQRTLAKKVRMKPFDLSGKTALVTGASSGLGVHFAKCLAAAGASVVLAARRADRLESLQAELIKSGATAKSVALDVQSGESIASALEAAGPIDIVVNNAGISIVKPALDMPEKDWDAVVDTNLRGAWLVAQGVAKRWVADKRPGTIVNIGSILGLRTIGQVAPYNASKAGLIHLTQVLAMEWARYRIRVNAICPGYIETEMNSAFCKTPAGLRLIERIPQRRIGLPEHLDGALLLLASDAGSFMTGSVITVDGGHTVSSL